MTSIAALVRALHDIDAVKGLTCGNCFYCTLTGYGGHCRLGHKPHGLDDGCEDFRWRPVDAFKAAPLPRGLETGKTRQRPFNESGGAV